MNNEIEQAYKDLDRFISNRFGMINDLLEIAPTGRILVSGSDSWARGWETGFKRCLVELKKAAEKIEKQNAKKDS